MPIRRGRFAPQNTFLETIAQKFDHGNSNFVLGSAQEKNNYPIVYCSDGFCELTGFSRSELMRRTCACNFLYGLETNQDDLQNIQNALKTQKELKKEVLFYKKNGSPFFCLLDIVPIKNEKGNVVLFLVSHKDVTTRKVSSEVHDDDNSTAPSGRRAPGERKLTRSRSRKFSRDVLLHLSRQYQTSNNAAKPQARRPVKRARSFSFTSERLPLYKRETTKKSKLLFLHYSNVKGLWDWWVLILTFYIAIMVPYNVAFSRKGKARDLIIVDMVIELFFILDIVVHFRTTFVNNGGRIVYDQKAIAIHYLKGWFILDFLAALPFEALYFINQSWQDSSAFNSHGSAYNEGFLVQLLKCGRLLRLFRVVRKLHRYTEYSTILLTLLMLAFAMVAHWLACVWYVIGLEEVSANSTISWLYQFGETIHMPFVGFSTDTGPDEGSAYVTALYFTLTSMTTVGFGNVSANTNAEKAFSVVVMLIGALMHAAIFGNVAAIIQKLYANRVRYHSRSNEIKQFIRVHHIEPDLANRLEDYFHTTWSLSGGVDTREILTTFPYELQADVCMHLYHGLLDLPVFAQAPRGLFRMISLQINPVYIGPGEYLLTQNDVINSVYYIASGSMEVLQGESVAAILGKGDLFGEDISRKMPIRRSNGDVRALTYCDVYYITRDKLQEVLHLYPDFSYKFSEKLELTYDLGASERDIWRRGGLDSISEDEEEEEDEVTSPETDKENTVTSHVRNRFDFNTKLNLPLHKRTNNFKADEPWTMYSRVQVKRPSRITISGRRSISPEEEPLLTSPPTGLSCHGDGIHGNSIHSEGIHGVNCIHGNGIHSKDIHGDDIYGNGIRGNGIHGEGLHGDDTAEEEYDADCMLAPESVLSDPGLEWEQESFALKEETGAEDPPELDHVIVDRIDEAIMEETDMGCESLEYAARSFEGSDSSFNFDKESFLKQLHISTETESDTEIKTLDQMTYENPENNMGNLDSVVPEGDRDEEVKLEEDKVSHDNEDLIGFTAFTTPVHGQRHNRRARFAQAPALSTPVYRCVSPSGSSNTGSLRDYITATEKGRGSLTIPGCASPSGNSHTRSLRDYYMATEKGRGSLTTPVRLLTRDGGVSPSGSLQDYYTATEKGRRSLRTHSPIMRGRVSPTNSSRSGSQKDCMDSSKGLDAVNPGAMDTALSPTESSKSGRSVSPAGSSRQPWSFRAASLRQNTLDLTRVDSGRSVSPSGSSRGVGRRQNTLDLTRVDSGRSSPRSPRERKRSISPALDSPYISMRRLFARTPPLESPCDSISREFEFPNDTILSHEAESVTQVPRSPLRRGCTEVSSNASSSSARAEDKDRPVPRRRKMSSVVQTPAIFASLLAQASSPYADFVPPQIVRESSITCDCSENDTCAACGDTFDGVSSCVEERCSNPDAAAGNVGNSSVESLGRTLRKCSGSRESFNVPDSPSSIRNWSESPDIIRDRSETSESDVRQSDSSSVERIGNFFDVARNRGTNGQDRLNSQERVNSDGSTHDINNILDGEINPDSSSIGNQEPSNDRCLSPGLMGFVATCDSVSSPSTRSSHELHYDPMVTSSDVTGDIIRDVTNDASNDVTQRQLTLTTEGVRYTVCDDLSSPELECEKEMNFESVAMLEKRDQLIQQAMDSTASTGRPKNELGISNMDDRVKYLNADRSGGGYIPPFFDEVSSAERAQMDYNEFSYRDTMSNTDEQFRKIDILNKRASTHSSSIHIPAKQNSFKSSKRTSQMSLDNVSVDELPQKYKECINSHPIRKPTLSGIHSMYSLQSLPGNDASVTGNPSRPMRSSFSEPHLYASYFQGGENEGIGEEFNDAQLEDIFKDVVSTKQAMERLQIILNSPEPDLCSELADTKETVKKLDRQVLNLNEDMASLSKDVKTVLELLRGLRNGQVEPRL